MICPCCNQDKEGEYLHVIAVAPNKFNYCCDNCLAARIISKFKFKFSDEDKEEIRRIVREEIDPYRKED